MRLLYCCFMYLLSPYLLVRLWLKGRRLPAYNKRIAERFSWKQKSYKTIDIWLHAVSLGEVIAATPLIEHLLAQNYSLLITTMTPTGSERVITYFSDKVAHQYIPYDLSGPLTRFFKAAKPRVGIIMETELWPNLIHHAVNAQVPLLLVNARLSARSFKGYQRIKWLVKPMLDKFTAILTQTPDDALRFQALGAAQDTVQALGNMKFDVRTDTVDSSTLAPLKKQWGEARPVVIVASTHEDEEARILLQLKRLQQHLPKVIMLIAPRHPERFSSVYQTALDMGFNTGLRSVIDSLNSGNEVVVLDSLGELLAFYQLSDYAFVGGSLVPVGGHNVLEPIAMQVPVISGSHVHNFKAICRDLSAAQAIKIVTNAEDAINAIIGLAADRVACATMVANAGAVLQQNKGAVARYVLEINKVINNKR